MKNENQGAANYSLIAKLLHWGFVGIFVYGIIKQVDNISALADTALLRFEIIFAAAFVGLLLLRFVYMKKTQKSALPESTPKVQHWAAKLVHYGMYVSLGSIAITGLIIGTLYWLGSRDGLLINGVVSLHELSVTASYYLIGIHVLAAVYHRFLSDGVWSAMVPVLKERVKS